MAVSLFKGCLINPASPTILDVWPNATIAVEDGIIKEVFSESTPIPEKYTHLPLTDFRNRLLIPAFSDLHIHISQYT